MLILSVFFKLKFFVQDSCELSMVEWLHQRLVFLGELLHEHSWEEEEMYNVLLMAKVCCLYVCIPPVCSYNL